jgi:hypothetical protein
MSRMDRVKTAILKTSEEARRNYEAHPHEYIRGFANGLILAEHHLNNYPGSPKLIERKATSTSTTITKPSPAPADTKEQENERP